MINTVGGRDFNPRVKYWAGSERGQIESTGIHSPYNNDPLIQLPAYRPPLPDPKETERQIQALHDNLQRMQNKAKPPLDKTQTAINIVRALCPQITDTEQFLLAVETVKGHL